MDPGFRNLSFSQVGPGKLQVNHRVFWGTQNFGQFLKPLPILWRVHSKDGRSGIDGHRALHFR
jgi:hypothetical protein